VILQKDIVFFGICHLKVKSRPLNKFINITITLFLRALSIFMAHTFHLWPDNVIYK